MYIQDHNWAKKKPLIALTLATDPYGYLKIFLPFLDKHC